MNYGKISVPYLSEEEIKRQANLFRKKNWNESVPVDMEYIIDVKLKKNIIPIPGMREICDDALITSDWSSVYVDHDKFYNEKYGKRLRFSYAHEIGHFILHKKIYTSFGIKKVEDFYKLLNDIPQKEYNNLEYQANKFAGHLLIPREKLAIEREKLIKENSSEFKNIDTKLINSYLAIPLSQVFGVSESSIEVALLVNNM